MKSRITATFFYNGKKIASAKIYESQVERFRKKMVGMLNISKQFYYIKIEY